MAKRMTDTAKWDDEWFMGLSAPSKLLWFYLCDSCDHAGLWKVNRKLAEFKIGCGIPWEDCLDEFGARVFSVDDEHWHIRKFVEFQYGPTPNDLNKVHKGVLRLLSMYSLPWCFKGPLKGLARGTEGAKEKETDKDKEKEKDSDAENPFSAEAMEQAKAIMAEDAKPKPPVPQAKSFTDFRAMHGRCYIGKDERPDWEALYRVYGWDVMHEMHSTLTEDRIYLNTATQWLSKNFRITG